jgi:hypothetical protein
MSETIATMGCLQSLVAYLQSRNIPHDVNTTADGVIIKSDSAEIKIYPYGDSLCLHATIRQSNALESDSYVRHSSDAFGAYMVIYELDVTKVRIKMRIPDNTQFTVALPFILLYKLYELLGKDESKTIGFLLPTSVM